MNIKIPGYEITEKLSESISSLIYRGYRIEDGQSVVLKVLRPEAATSEGLSRFRHEFDIISRLHLPGVIKTHGLEHYQDSFAMVLEDTGGESLDRLLKQKQMSLRELLQLAIRLAEILGSIHQRGVVHKNINPSHIIWSSETGQLRLIDFDLAEKLPPGSVGLQPPAILEGTLEYISPEQTGRMNCPIDYRTDFYSLGVTFYRMFTGKLPFQADDPLEWVHCHVARLPQPPEEIAPDLPPTLSSIIMKLLAKVMDNRYQSAYGLQYDLEKCLAQWDASVRVAPFVLGTRDISDRLLVPRKLYGREAELAALIKAFDRMAASGVPEAVLVSGYSGIGKSSLVQELDNQIVRKRGYFISCKFDHHNRVIPYSMIVHAFRGLVQQILTESEDRIAFWKEQLQEALGTNGQLIVDLIPHVELIIGPQPPAPELPPTEAQNRFHMVFRNFVGVFSKAEHPIVLFLDDMQWLDEASLKLVEHLLTNPDMRYLFFIGAYRDNEVSPGSPLVTTLDEIRKTGLNVQHIALGPLSLDPVSRLISDALHCNLARVAPLARFVFDKTQGNPFFVVQFLTTLHEEGLLTFNPEQRVWTWDISSIQAKEYMDNVAELMIGKLMRLPMAVRHALQLAGCLGNTFDLRVLALIDEGSQEAMKDNLAEAVREGLLLCRDDTCSFLHDRVREAAYTLIPETQRTELHLRIGRRLVAHTPPEQMKERIFDLVTHFNLGASLITEQEERTQVAELNLRAALNARMSTAYRVAVDYLSTGSALLDGDLWDSQYDLMYALLLNLAECEFLTGAFDEAERLFPALLQHARTSIDKAAVYRVKIDTYTTEGKDDKAIESAIECLRMFGIVISSHPSTAEVEEAYRAVWRNIGDRRIEDLIDLPLMTDPEMQAAMEILVRLYAPAYHTDNNLFYLHLCHAVNFSLKHGAAPASTHAYGWFGIILGSMFHRYQEGFKFTRLAFDLMERHGFQAYRAKAYFQMRIISYWTQPIDKMLKYSWTAFEAAVETGDVPIACFNYNHTILGMLTRGDRLSEVYHEAKQGLDFVRRAGFRDVCDMIVGIERFVQAMRGQTRHLSTYDDDRFSEAEFESELAKERMPTLLFYYYVVKLMARFLSGDYEAALAAGEKSKSLLWSALGSAQGHYFYFYYALTLAAVFGKFSPEKQKEALDVLAAHQEQLRIWAENYPPTFYNTYAIVSAEIARIRGQSDEAMHLYEQAIRSARENGFVQNEGLAYELAARFYRGRGLDMMADAHLLQARSCYARWGADGKVRELDLRYPRLKAQSSPAPVTAFGANVEQLDSLAVVKASQAISSKIVLDQLLDALLRIVLEQSGAQHSVLLLVHGEELSLTAEAGVKKDHVDVHMHREQKPSTSSVPLSILNYVRRSREKVILEDASAPNLFFADDYFSRRRPKSVLCMPLMRQAELVGILYLENSLVTHVFTPDRLTVLELLASQAAISIENARLYMDLHRENIERRRKEKELRNSEARYRALYRDNPSMIFTLDAEGTILSINPFAAAQLGYTVDELKGQPVLKVFHEDDRLAVAEQLQASLRNPYQVYRWQFRKIRKDGNLLWVDELAQTVYDLNGALNVLVVCQDISEFRRAQEALQQARDELEHRVQERTAELKASNILLGREIEEHHQTEKILEEQKILFETILKQAADGIVVTDSQGKPLLANAAAKRMAMADPESADLDTLRTDLGRTNNSNGYRIPLEKGSIPRALQGKMTVGLESRIMRPDGSYYDVLMSTAPLRKSDGAIFGTVSILSDITERKQAEEALRSLPSRLLDAQEEERKRISRELHDSIGSSLSAVKYSLEHIANQMEQGAISHEPLRSLVSMVQQAIEELRRIMTDLRPSILDDLGIIAATGWFCRQFQTIYPSIRIEKEVAVEEDDVPEFLKIVIFRIMQEALSNAAKYSKADLVNLSLVKRENAIELIIEDNGVGFDLNSVYAGKERKGGGLGLTSMRERVDLSGGSFSLESRPGEGVKVHVRWPIKSF